MKYLTKEKINGLFVNPLKLERHSSTVMIGRCVVSICMEI